MAQEPGGTDKSAPAGAVVEELLIDVACATGSALEARAGERRLAYLTEARDLAPVFSEELERRLKGTSYRPAKSGERRIDWPEHFPRVGNVDALIVERLRPSDPVLIELKCDYGRRGLWACAWDAVKCAVGLRLGARAAYLLAGNTNARWQERPPGAELFEGGQWSTLELRERHATAFRGYEELADPIPTRVPPVTATSPVGEPVPIDVTGTGWALRLCRVEAPGDAWVDWAPFLTAEQAAAALERRRNRR